MTAGISRQPVCDSGCVSAPVCRASRDSRFMNYAVCIELYICCRPLVCRLFFLSFFKQRICTCFKGFSLLTIHHNEKQSDYGLWTILFDFSIIPASFLFFNKLSYYLLSFRVLYLLLGGGGGGVSGRWW